MSVVKSKMSRRARGNRSYMTVSTAHNISRCSCKSQATMIFVHDDGRRAAKSRESAARAFTAAGNKILQ